MSAAPAQSPAIRARACTSAANLLSLHRDISSFISDAQIYFFWFVCVTEMIPSIVILWHPCALTQPLTVWNCKAGSPALKCTGAPKVRRRLPWHRHQPCAQTRESCCFINVHSGSYLTPTCEFVLQENTVNCTLFAKKIY